MRMDLTEVARGGLIERTALVAAGAPSGTISSWLSRGAIVEVIAGIYRLPGEELSWRAMCRAVAAWGGEACALSHHTAAALHGLECFIQEAPIHLSAMDGRRTPKYCAFGLNVHKPRTLKETDVTLVDGLRVTSIERTLLDLAATMSPRALERVLGECLRRGLVKPARLRQLREIGRGRRGNVTYSNVIDLRGATLVRTDSVLEDRFMKAFVAEGLELLPEARWPIQKWDMRYRADFAFPKFNLAIEIDSWTYHTSRQSWTDDVTKNNDVVSWGWSILRFTEEALRDTRGMARIIREALVSRGW